MCVCVCVWDVGLGIAALCGHTTNAAFSKSKALLGSIEGIERTRVTDLQNPDPEHSLAPHWRAPLISFANFTFL